MTRQSKPGKLGYLAAFSSLSKAIGSPNLNRAAQEEPETIAYFLIRQGPSTFGVFDAFADEERRLAHYNARWPQLQERAKALFVEGSLVMEKVEILGAKLPG